MSASSFDLVGESGDISIGGNLPAWIGLTMARGSLLTGLETRQTAGGIGDSWTDIFLESRIPQTSADFEAATELLFSEEVVARDATALEPVAFNGSVVIEQTDPLTGAGIAAAQLVSSPEYPGYLLQYLPGQALEDRPAVAQWQTQMQRRGWNINVDGLYGSQSANVARAFQREKGLIADGIVGSQTWKAAFDDSTLTPVLPVVEEEPEVVSPVAPIDDMDYPGRMFSYSAFVTLQFNLQVQKFQQRLQDLGYGVETDGLFGRRSAIATRNFQRQANLDTDGIVGPQTWAAVFSSNAPEAPDEPVFNSPSGGRQINNTGLNLIKDFEGRRLNAYQDAVGVWTIGYGHTQTAYPGQRITEAGATELLRYDVGRFERAVEQAVRVPISDNQFAALVSFAFNVGSGALNSSTLLRRLNADDFYGAADEFLRWNRAGGQELYGLTRRRIEERALFLS